MSSGFETIEVVDPWLLETLTADDKIVAACGLQRIGSELFDLDATNNSPYVTWQMVSSRDVMAVSDSGERIWADCLYNVRAIVKGRSYKPIVPVAQRIEALLHGAKVSTEFGYLTAVREQIVQFPEQSGSTQFRHLGAIYRIRAYKNS